MAGPWRRLGSAAAAASCTKAASWRRRRRLDTWGGSFLRYCSENVGLQEKSPDPQEVFEVANINKFVTEERIVLPRKKTWDKLAVLQALASTVHRDPTASQSVFQDDPYLIPRTSTEFRLFFMSKESGENAAKYIVNKHPIFFEKDIAEPHIPCLMPENLELQLEEVTEAALKERIQLRKVKAAVDMYDQLQQAGTSVSLETSNSLLDLLCFYGDREPVQDTHSAGNGESEEQEEGMEARKQRGSMWRTSDIACVKWSEKNNAERVFSLMPEKNAHSYCTMIRGMVKHRAHSKAFDMYTDLLNNGLKGDVYTFNALVLSAVEVKDKYVERWDLVEGLLKEMAQQNVQPNLLTFNSVLKALRQCGSLGRSMALQTLSEMSALRIEPSLATYDHLLGVFYKSAISASGPTDIIYEVMDEIEGKNFHPQDPADDNFFSNAMRICLDIKDVQLAYRLHRVVETGENWKMMGDMYQQSSYCGRFLHLLCMMEHLDVALKWYKELVPSMLYPNSEGMLGLLRALDAASRLDMIPQIWKAFSTMNDGIYLGGLAKFKTQVAFADCAADVHEVQERSRVPLEWTATSLGNCVLLFARAGRTQKAWSMLQLFKKHNRVPSDVVMNEVLNCIKQSNDPDQALNLVTLAADFSLQSTSRLAERVQKEFQLSEEQRNTLDDLLAVSSHSSE
ncbi:PREDICTED: pentatricopeptide repeat domain-containing protein 3, mitochondrial [Gekko japonicus]|uniref:Small ribosomal subunit protein mS39 n=1 Tax=Gekko japonicus TaxID=146911 RepID=A0ABM1JLU5_GEKJA|nr:PREDICTED: pentatricopeptide repeat domain-containing protein 3, mitochondrial [Gekko japonicus]